MNDAKKLEDLLGLRTQPVTLTFLETPPASVPRITDAAPSGCTYWKRTAIYAPLADSPCEPDVVLVRGNAKQMMLLTEAANAAGISTDSPLMGRPTYAAVPVVAATERAVASLGCIGNRVYTDLADDELYVVLPGKHLSIVTEKLAAIVNANRELEQYHHGHV